MMTKKANADDFPGRFREIISDPINLLIPRHPEAGFLRDGLVTLHNGHRVPVHGPGAYYGDFSEILILNRGVHEPLEEFVFSRLLLTLPEAPKMLELGAYWGHYSMWLLQARSAASVHLVEPEAENLDAGRANFARHGYQGAFQQAFVSNDYFRVDDFLRDSDWKRLDVLHSDIQGYESEMLDGAAASLAAGLIDYVCVSTHSQSLHLQIVEKLTAHRYRIEVSADFNHETTCHDGFLLAARPDLPTIWKGPMPLSREAICKASPRDLIAAITETLDNLEEDSGLFSG